MTSSPVLPLLFLTAAFGLAAPAQSQDKPRSGGELVFLVPSEPPSYDGHAEGTFEVVHPLAPHYNTLRRIDPTDTAGTRVVPDSPTRGRSPRTADLYARVAEGRQVPRRDRGDLARREGVLGQDRVPARGRDLLPQGRLPRGGGYRGAGSLYDPVSPQMARGLLSHQPRGSQ